MAMLSSQDLKVKCKGVPIFTSFIHDQQAQERAVRDQKGQTKGHSLFLRKGHKCLMKSDQ